MIALLHNKSVVHPEDGKEAIAALDEALRNNVGCQVSYLQNFLMILRPICAWHFPFFSCTALKKYENCQVLSKVHSTSTAKAGVLKDDMAVPVDGGHLQALRKGANSVSTGAFKVCHTGVCGCSFDILSVCYLRKRTLKPVGQVRWKKYSMFLLFHCFTPDQAASWSVGSSANAKVFSGTTPETGKNACLAAGFFLGDMGMRWSLNIAGTQYAIGIDVPKKFYKNLQNLVCLVLCLATLFAFISLRHPRFTIVTFRTPNPTTREAQTWALHSSVSSNR